MIDFDKIHATIKSHSDVIVSRDGWMWSHFSSEPHIIVIQVQDVVMAGRTARTAVPFVYDELGCSTVPLKLDLVPVSIIDECMFDTYETFS